MDNLYFSTFHGGGNSDWAPSVDCNIWFDNVLIASEAEDVFNFTSVNNRNLNDEFRAYPNPVKANGFLKVAAGEQSSKSYKTEWLDFTGKTVLSSIETSGSSILVPDLTPGIYVLKITLNEQVILKKIVVE